jgi:hypothetical protein
MVVDEVEKMVVEGRGLMMPEFEVIIKRAARHGLL